MKTFFTIVLILLILRWLLKPFIKLTVQTTINKMANDAMQRQQQYYQQKRQKSEGTISVDFIPGKEKSNGNSNNKNTGDYVDFEEIK
jgi:hypothetical protein